MSGSELPLSAFADDPPARDFRRANGAPMVRRADDPTKWDRYSRPSGWGGDLDDESALTNWRIDRAMEGVAVDPGLRATVASKIGHKEGAVERREKAIQRGRGEEASDTGTALHLMAQRVEEAADGYVVPPPYDADIAAYLMALERAGLRSMMIECHLCADEWRAAGTADRIYEVTRELRTPSGDVVEPGQLILGDLKTGKLKDYTIPGYTIQMAIYVDGCLYDVETNERSPMPDGLRTDWGLLVHLPAGAARCSLLWCDLEVGRFGARLVREVRSWRKRADFVVDFAFPRDDDEVAVMSQSPDEMIAESITEPEEAPVDPEWMTVMLPFAQQRIEVIGSVPEARAALLRSWPADTPPPAAGVTGQQLSCILNILDAVEAAFSIPFPADDPRVEWSAGLHKSQVIRNNEPEQSP